METELIVKYFPEIEEEKIEQFKELKSLFGFWNEKINLISRKDFDSFEQLFLGKEYVEKEKKESKD